MVFPERVKSWFIDDCPASHVWLPKGMWIGSVGKIYRKPMVIYLKIPQWSRTFGCARSFPLKPIQWNIRNPRFLSQNTMRDPSRIELPHYMARTSTNDIFQRITLRDLWCGKWKCVYGRAESVTTLHGLYIHNLTTRRSKHARKDWHLPTAFAPNGGWKKSCTTLVETL